MPCINNPGYTHNGDEMDQDGIRFNGEKYDQGERISYKNS